jgi:hypothetical protein
MNMISTLKSIGRVNLIRYAVIEASRECLREGRSCSWIGVRETKQSKEPEHS